MVTMMHAVMLAFGRCPSYLYTAWGFEQGFHLFMLYAPMLAKLILKTTNVKLCLLDEFNEEPM